MILHEEVYNIGNTSKPHGINGEISVSIDVECDMGIGSCVIFNIDGIYVPFFIETIRPKSANAYLIKFKNINTENEALELSNKELYIPKTDLPDGIFDDNDDEGMYAEDFIGFNVFTTQNERLGVITDFDDSTENVLFMVERPDESIFYIPIVDEFIVSVDTDEKTVIMELPQGLVELK